MENPSHDQNAESPEEKIKRLIDEYEKDFEPTVENGLFIRDISDIMTEYPQILVSVQKRFHSLYGFIDADDPDFRQLLNNALREKMSQHYDILCGANVRLGRSMLALQKVPQGEGGGLRYYRSDADEHVEGEILGISSAELPQRDIITMLVEESKMLGNTDTLEVPRELQMCVKMQNAVTVGTQNRSLYREIGEVIVPLYRDAINLARVDIATPLDDIA